MRCSSWAYLAFRRKYSWWRITSLSTSSTKIQKASEEPWTCPQKEREREREMGSYQGSKKSHQTKTEGISPPWTAPSTDDPQIPAPQHYWRLFLQIPDCPFTFSSHWKSGVIVSSTFRVDLVMGCKWTDSSSLGNRWTYLWIVFPILGIRISSPADGQYWWREGGKDLLRSIRIRAGYSPWLGSHTVVSFWHGSG